ncbi:YrhB domain-containing protein [Pasteurella skyensis]|nr:YrhB domain-containing protein [Pasteurella skyensis]MDP8171248.1 YrhB domain-containing protein [Pasteurella skyensis]MDP8174696.1 YrhB domain-containing protein [Pasteurella skyensis]
MITKQYAQNKIEKLLKSDFKDQVVILEEATIESKFCWVFFYQSKKYIETQDFSYQLAGNAPYIVSKIDGAIEETGTAYNIAHYIDIFENKMKR